MGENQGMNAYHIKKSLKNKQSVKHAVFCIDMIDTLIESEKDAARITILKQLRKEAKKVWPL